MSSAAGELRIVDGKVTAVLKCGKQACPHYQICVATPSGHARLMEGVHRSRYVLPFIPTFNTQMRGRDMLVTCRDHMVAKVAVTVVAPASGER